jgi:hypothetical protein
MFVGYPIGEPMAAVYPQIDGERPAWTACAAPAGPAAAGDGGLPGVVAAGLLAGCQARALDHRTGGREPGWVVDRDGDSPADPADSPGIQPAGGAAMKPSWPMASPSGPRPDRLRHEAAWSLPPQGGSAGPQDLHLPQHRIKDSFLPQVILAFRARLGPENLSKMLYKCLVAASTIRSFSISGSGKSPGFAGGVFAVAKSISNRLPANCLTSCWKIPIISRCQVRPRA